MPTTNLTLRVQPGSDALDRVVCTCRRRSLDIVALNFAHGRLTLTVSGAERQMRGIDRWLVAVVNVFEVAREEPGAVAPALGGNAYVA